MPFPGRSYMGCGSSFEISRSFPTPTRLRDRLNRPLFSGNKHLPHHHDIGRQTAHQMSYDRCFDIYRRFHEGQARQESLITPHLPARNHISQGDQVSTQPKTFTIHHKRQSISRPRAVCDDWLLYITYRGRHCRDDRVACGRMWVVSPIGVRESGRESPTL